MTMLTLKRTRSRTGVRSLAVAAMLVAATVALPVLPGATASPPDLLPVEVEVANWRSVPGSDIAAERGTSNEQRARSGSRSQDVTADTNGPTAQEGDELPAQEGDWSLSDPVATDALVMIGADWGGGPDELTQARTLVDGIWGEWIDLDLPDGGPDPGTDEAAQAKPVSEPLWIGGADAFQVRTTAEPADLVIPALEAEGRLDFRAAPPRFAPAAAAASPQPTIVTRAQWGADESIRKGSPTYASAASFAVVHHTAGSNSYSCTESASIVNGIYRWHVLHNGWSDIGYNFVVDKCGTIYEGRFGGVHRTVVGAHAGGWNTGSIGIAVLGNFELAGQTATSASRAAIRDTLAWKFDLHRIDPMATIQATGGGFASSRHPAGTTLTIPTIVGHALLNWTACPGANFYGYVRDGDLARQVRARMDQFLPMPVGAVPLVGDFNGDGVTNTGYRAGTEFVLRMTDGRVVRFWWGLPTDTPIMGDWNGDGVDTIGLIRGREWLLRHSNSRGPVDRSFFYGHPSDIFVTGDWNGDGLDTPGVRRGWEWILRTSPGAGPADLRFGFGRPTDTPVVGDWNGNGVTTVGVVRGNIWLLRDANSRGAVTYDFLYGAESDAPVAGDWNGSGRHGVGAERRGLWLLRDDLSRGTVDHRLNWSAR